MDMLNGKHNSEDNTMKIKVRYAEEIEEIKTIEQGDWIDLRCAEDTSLEKGEFKLISLGVAMQLPEGYEAHVLPRSSTFSKYKIIMTNSMGIIDNSYSGNNDIWRFPALAIEKTFIAKGDRICQFRIMKKQEDVDFEKVEDLGNTDRGGFGSTGVK